MIKYLSYIQCLFVLLFASCNRASDNSEPQENFCLDEININGQKNLTNYTDIFPNAAVLLTFSQKVNVSSVSANITLKKQGENANIPLVFDFSANPAISFNLPDLQSYNNYELIINTGLKAESGASVFTGKVFGITTGIDATDKFERIADEDLLTLTQRQTFRYFWDFGHPTSGMARERTTSGNTVASGGTGFGIMAMIVAAERNFISKAEALERIQKIVTFLDLKCTKYHGAFAHWINGETGATIPFSANDNGGDLVETAHLMQGLLTARAYFNGTNITETNLRSDITKLWEAVEWTWYRQNGQNALYWHWSLDKNWIMNLKISGWNEGLMVYLLATSSPTFPISKNVYDEGWTRNGAFANGKTYYGYTLPLGNDYGGPLFFTHYSFLGLDPRNLKDKYADYWLQNKNHTLINYRYCIENPKQYGGYGADCWGLTASDGNNGYSAHSPTNDKGVIAPTAAISSMPYAPEQSMQALRFFYYKLGDKLWSEYGFVDAFNLSAGWFDNQHIAIDQGPIIVMIENYRSGLLWSLFMSDPEIQAGLAKLGFQTN